MGTGNINGSFGVSVERTNYNEIASLSDGGFVQVLYGIYL